MWWQFFKLFSKKKKLLKLGENFEFSTRQNFSDAKTHSVLQRRNIFCHKFTIIIIYYDLIFIANWSGVSFFSLSTPFRACERMFLHFLNRNERKSDIKTENQWIDIEKEFFNVREKVAWTLLLFDAITLKFESTAIKINLWDRTHQLMEFWCSQKYENFPSNFDFLKKKPSILF